MAKRKSADKFHVGQTVAFVLDKSTGHERHNGKLTTVLSQRVLDEWHCADPAHPERGQRFEKSWRYSVIRPGDGGTWHVTECMLRAVYDGEPLSTWEKFAKKTGIDIKAPVRARKRKSVA